MYSYHTIKAYLAQCRMRHKVPTWAGLEAFSTPLKLHRRILKPEAIEKENAAMVLEHQSGGHNLLNSKL